MIIVVGNWKKKVAQIVVLVLVIGVFAASIPFFTGKLCHQVPAVSGWFKDEHPSGNPMRVEKKIENKEKVTVKDSSKKTAKETKFDQTMDQFVIKLQDFYYEE